MKPLISILRPRLCCAIGHKGDSEPDFNSYAKYRRLFKSGASYCDSMAVALDSGDLDPGWVYEIWNGGGTKIYTPAFIADYIIQNSVGAWIWHYEAEKRGEGVCRAFCADDQDAVEEAREVGRRFGLGCDKMLFTNEYMAIYPPISGRESLPDRIVDPACGSGNLVLKCIIYIYSYLASDSSCTPLAAMNRAIKMVRGYDIDADAIAVAHAAIKSACARRLGCDAADLADPLLYVYSDSSYGFLNEPIGECDIIICNPPYLGAGKLTPAYRAWLRANYKHSYMNLFTAFMDKCLRHLPADGLMCVITPNVYLFLSSFERFRAHLNQVSEAVLLATADGQVFPRISGDALRTVVGLFAKRTELLITNHNPNTLFP